MGKIPSNASGTIWIGDADPGFNETSVEQGNFWYTPSTGHLFICANATAGIQSWFQIQIK